MSVSGPHLHDSVTPARPNQPSGQAVTVLSRRKTNPVTVAVRRAISRVIVPTRHPEERMKEDNQAATAGDPAAVGPNATSVVRQDISLVTAARVVAAAVRAVTEVVDMAWAVEVDMAVAAAAVVEPRRVTAVVDMDTCLGIALKGRNVTTVCFIPLLSTFQTPPFVFQMRKN